MEAYSGWDLDFFLAFFVCVYLTAKAFGNSTGAPVFGEPELSFGLNGMDFRVGGISALLAALLMIAYFVILGRTGGTVFQRMFGVKRVRAAI
jgi:hypothetical protein